MSVPPGKPGMLLLRLALVPNRSYGRDYLVESVWPECEPEVGRPRLRFTLTVLRQSLGLSGVVVASKNEVALDWSKVDTDVERFRRTVAKVDRLCSAEALVLACDGLLGELAEQYSLHWLDGPRTHLRTARIDALLKAAKLFKEAGNFAQSENALREALKLDPLRESLHSATMQILDEQDRTAEALAHYEEYRLALHRSLGLTPSDQLIQLARTLAKASGKRDSDAEIETVSDAQPIMRPCYGRDALKIEVEEAMAESSLVTLIGLGGSGKTRLAFEIYRSHPFGPGKFVDLSDANEEGEVYSALSGAFDLRTADRRELLRRMERTGGLLILDNCEQVLQTARDFASLTSREAPSIRILATSRERLGASGETVIEVAGLSVPEFASASSLQEVAESPSIKLLLTAAKAAKSEFELSPVNAQQSIRLVRAVDGLPLSIELAAARLRLMSLSQILEMLDQGPEILSSRHRPERQRRVSDIVAWSISRLSNQAKRLLCHLAVFASGWDIGVVESIVQSNPRDAAEALDELIDNSLIARTDEHRFRILESIRPVALHLLGASGEESTARELQLRAYREAYRDLGEWWSGPDSAYWLRKIREDMPNLRVALQWAAKRPSEDQAGEELACGIWRYWQSAGSVLEAYKLLKGLLDAHPNQPRNKVMAEVLSAVGRYEMRLGRLNEAYVALTESMEISRALRDVTAEGNGLRLLAEINVQRRNPAEAERLFREAMSHSEAEGNANGVRMSLDGIARSLAQKNDHAEAIPYYQRSVEIGIELANETGDFARPIPTLNNLGDSYIALGELLRAQDCLTRALELAKRSEDVFGQSVILINLGSVAIEVGNNSKARQYFTEALQIRRGIGEPKILARAEVQMGLVSVAEDNPGEADRWFQAAIAGFDAIDEAYEAAIPRLWATLSRRDLDGAAGHASRAVKAVLADPSSTSNTLAMLVSANLLIRFGQPKEGAVLLGACQSARARRDVATPRLERKLEKQTAAALGNGWESFLEAGRELSDEAALERAASALADLTRRS